MLGPVFHAVLESVPIYIYIEPRARLRATRLFTGSQDTFVSFHLRRRDGPRTFQLLKLLNPSRLRGAASPFSPLRLNLRRTRNLSDREEPWLVSFYGSCSCILRILFSEKKREHSVEIFLRSVRLCSNSVRGLGI